MPRIPRQLFLPSAIILLFFIFITSRRSYNWRSLPLESIGFGEEHDIPIDELPPVAILDEVYDDSENGTASLLADGSKYRHGNIVFTSGKVKPPGHPYTKALIVTKTKSEDTEWLEEIPKELGIQPWVYIVDDTSAPLHPPKNKGHEVMVYLTYIIDNYDNLSDTNIFVHSHQKAWHNNVLLDLDMVEQLKHLSSERVQREGYMNLRCDWEPGCPAWMHPGTVEENPNKQEEAMLARSWSEIFPFDPIPTVLSQPCCAQFAVSRERIRTLRQVDYTFYRDWLLHTRLSDYISGRVFEYIWQFIFTGKAEVCPAPNVCFCDGYGICFGGAEHYQAYVDHVSDRDHWENELREWRKLDDDLRLAKEDGRINESKEMEIPEFGKDEEYQQKIDELNAWLRIERKKAFERGQNPKYRALEAGRHWVEGDGF